MNKINNNLSNPNPDMLGACRLWPCFQCDQDRASVIIVDERLICIKCRFDKIGKSALYEGLYNGMDKH